MSGLSGSSGSWSTLSQVKPNSSTLVVTVGAPSEAPSSSTMSFCVPANPAPAAAR
jgi:hypothetical protein